MFQDEISSKIFDAVLVEIIGVGLFYIIFYIIKKYTKTNKFYFGSLLEKYIHKTGLLVAILVGFNIIIQLFEEILPKELFQPIRHILEILLILSIGLLCMKIISVMRDYLIHRVSLKDEFSYALRSAQTKYQLIQRILNLVILFMAVGIAMMTFPNIRSIGSTLLASAGVVGIVLGFAAQKSLGSLFAGLQIAISQPIKLGDFIVVQGKYGTVVEITLSYVIVNTWDERRLILPISYFIENSFENWTLESAKVVGQVKIYTDYTLPMDPLREQFKVWIAESPLWDKRNSSVNITGFDSKTMEIRFTMSAMNASNSFDLECYIREKAIQWIQTNYPTSLPVSRWSMPDPDMEKAPEPGKV